VLHWETYDRVDEDEFLCVYDAIMVATGIYEGRRIPVPGRPREMEESSWMEHSARNVSKTVRKKLRIAIKKQGFPLK
jgi:hypothetical protein